MKKKIITRCLVGAPIGFTISILITIIISAFMGDGKYYPAVPDFIRDCGGELNAVILQAVLALVYGAAWGGASVVWEMDWSILKQTVTHLVICSVATFPIAYVTHWMSHDAGGILLYFGIFALVYASIWFSQYSALKKRVKELNRKIKEN